MNSTNIKLSKIASWNVNSIRIRLPMLESLINRENPDVILLQETKCTDMHFPFDKIENYNAYSYGQPSYNGIGILVRKNLEISEFKIIEVCNKGQARCALIVVEGVCIISVYVPCGDMIGDKYLYKLHFLENLNRCLQNIDHAKLIIGGDFNVALSDEDINMPPRKPSDHVLSMPEFRSGLMKVMQDNRLDDLSEKTSPKNPFTWWDYRNPVNGWRIDYILTRGLTGVVKAHKEYRFMQIKSYMGGKEIVTKPSDHVPLVLKLN